MILSVIIPTYKRNDLLTQCLEKLSPEIQTLDSNLFEVIITDDSPNFDAKNLIEEKFTWTKWVEGPHRGPASNRNNGAKKAKGDWFVFIDDDCLPDKNVLLEYYNEIIKNEYKAIEGYINADRPRERFDEEAPLNLNGGCFWSCNIAIEKSLFISINGFDEGFPYPAMEDVDFAQRLAKKTKTCFLASAKVIHPWRKVKPFHSYKKWIVSNKYILKKNNTKIDIRFRIKRFNLFLGLMYSHTLKLKQFSFKGIGVYFEHLWFQFLMIFIRVK